ncbi:MAG: hypothetical protein AB1608_08085 [Thermoproteota archaeon]
MSIREELVFCIVCGQQTNQLFLKSLDELAIKSRGSLTERFQCNVCKTINERTLQECWKCNKHTLQSMIEEKLSDDMFETMEQIFQCNSCGEINETSRYSDEHIERWLSAKDDEGVVVHCDYCMCNKKQDLIDKKHSKISDEYDLTTYRCKTCKNMNYGTQPRLDTK